MPLSTIISAANSTDSFFSKDKGFLSGLGLNSTFSSTMGGSTSFIAGTGRTTNIYSSERKTVHNLAEMARFLYNNNQMGGALGFLFGFLTNEGGGDEGGGSSAYVPEDKTKDLQLKAAIDLLNGVKVVSNVKPKEEKPKDGEKPDTTAN